MKPFRLVRRAITWSSLGLAGGALLITTRHLLATPQPLESALPGEGRIDRRHEGDIYYNLAGPADADALVLLHDFYPGASNFEFRRVFAQLAETHRVYAPDWLGFGMSERPALAYTGEFYAHLLREYLRGTVGRPAAVLAHGLAGNVAVRAASDEPELFSRLVLVAPRARAGTEEAPTLGQAIIRGAHRSSLGLVPYATLATRAALRWQLQRRAARPGEGAATDDAVDHLYASAHQFGGQFAPLAQLTGELDLPLLNALALLEPPVLVVAGERDTVQPRTELEDLVLVNPHAQLVMIAEAGDAIYEDAPDTFVDRVNLWLSSERTRHTPRLADVMRRGPGAPLPPRDRAVPPASVSVSAPGAALHGGILSPEEEFAETASASEVAKKVSTAEDRSPAKNIEQETKPGEPRFDPTSPTPEMIGRRGDVRADAAPPELERELEAPSEAPADGAMTAPQPVPAEAAITRNQVERTGREDEGAETRETAYTLAAMEEQVSEEAARLDERIQAAGPATERGGTEAGEETTTEAELPTPAAVTEEPPSPTPPAAETGQRSASQPPDEAAHTAARRTPRATPGPAGRGQAAAGETRQAPSRTGTQPASGKGASKGSSAQPQTPGPSADQAGGAKRQSGRKAKHPRR
jgi:pimeloyl-ACP methyl ester carboxylesterase